jgi:hypothetical protein
VKPMSLVCVWIVGAAAGAWAKSGAQESTRMAVNRRAFIRPPVYHASAAAGTPKLYLRNSTESAEAMPAAEKAMPRYQ